MPKKCLFNVQLCVLKTHWMRIKKKKKILLKFFSITIKFLDQYEHTFFVYGLDETKVYTWLPRTVTASGIPTSSSFGIKFIKIRFFGILNSQFKRVSKNHPIGIFQDISNICSFQRDLFGKN